MVASSVDFIDVGDLPEEPAAGEEGGPEATRSLSSQPLPTGGTLTYTDLPYTFAKRHGIILEQAKTGGLLLVHRPGVQLNALSEARRKA